MAKFLTGCFLAGMNSFYLLHLLVKLTYPSRLALIALGLGCFILLALVLFLLAVSWLPEQIQQWTKIPPRAWVFFVGIIMLGFIIGILGAWIL